jgi:hypothetical protein
VVIHEEPVLPEQVEGFALLVRRRPAGEKVLRRAIQQCRHVARDDELRVGERVHQKDLIASL